MAAFFDNITHRVLLAKLARRIRDPQVLAMLKWFLKGAGRKGIPQGSPLSPLLANVALNDLDHALDRGRKVITYVRYLDDIVVLANDNEQGSRWLNRALARIDEEAAAVGVNINRDKTHVLSVTDTRAVFSFLGFDFRWEQSRRTGKYFSLMTPKAKKVVEVQRRVAEILRHCRHLKVTAAVTRINAVLRGWANYFRAGHASKAMHRVGLYAEQRIRRFAARQRKRQGFGWNRWSRETVYKRWGLYANYATDWTLLTAGPSPQGNITPA